MSFSAAVKNTEILSSAYQRGLQALKRSDRSRITCANSRNCTGSVNLESALSDSCPNKPIWDYGIGYRTIEASEIVYWVEVHPASSKNVQEMLNKVAWLKNWLTSARLLNGLQKHFVWVASGKVSLLPHSPQRKRIAQAGIDFQGGHLTLK
ncbi:MAG: hypothetical protein ABSA16_03415 [Thermoguttaceae bacterium]